MVQTIQIQSYPHVQEKVAEVIMALETMKALLAASEIEARLDQWGTMMPDPYPLLTASTYFPRMYPRLMEILQLLGASGLVMLPVENDFHSKIGKTLKHYMASSQADGFERVKLFRLAWDLCMSAFGTRQTQYERFFFGDPSRMAGQLYLSYDKSPYTESVNEFLSDR
jgi:4-hydroxyphenylacetate 3-monooxygenase